MDKALARAGFSQLNEVFDQIYVLTLPRAQQRQKNIEKKLEGLNWRFFYGVDKLNLSTEQVKAENVYDDARHRNLKRTHRSMTLGEIACTLSHRKIWEDAIENNYQKILILEDDVEPDIRVLKEFERQYKELPQDWDVILLGYRDNKGPGIGSKLAILWYKLCHTLHLANWHKFDKSLFSYFYPESYSDSFNYFHKCVGTHAYAVSIDAARKYTAYQTPVILQADRPFLYYNLVEKLKIFMPKTPYFVLSADSEDSFIQNDRK